MSSLSQRLHLGVQQKQILTPGLVQMVTVLQLNRLELKDMIVNEIAANPVLEESAEAGEELTPAEVQSLLERERQAEPADQAILDRVDQSDVKSALDAPTEADFSADSTVAPAKLSQRPPPPKRPQKPRPTHSTKLILEASSKIISIPASRALLQNPSKSPPSKRFCPRR